MIIGKFRSMTWLLLIVVISATIRMWGFGEMQYHHDELSALLRTSFDSLGELVEKGIMVDGHPAFTQWFLWCYTAMVGYWPPLVKLPFIMAGCVSVLTLYHLARLLFNNRVAMVSSALMAVSQYAVLYSQWARPYAFGVMFMLLAGWALLQYLHRPRKLMLAAFAVFTALSGYTHYFALLQVMVFSALVLIPYRSSVDLRWIIVAALGALVMWLPHLNLTLHHLSLGGIGYWLREPEPDYWWYLLSYSFHFSLLFSGMFLATAIALAFSKQPRRSLWSRRMVLVGAWLIPYIVAYTYSIKVSALMHNGTMFFTFPMLVILCGSIFHSMQLSTVKVAAVVTLVCGGLTLMLQRHHLPLNIRTEYQDPLLWAASQSENLNSGPAEERLMVLADLRSDAVNFMTAHGIADYSRVVLMEALWKAGDLAQFLDTLSADKIMVVTTAASLPEYLAIVHHHYPVLIAARGYHTGEAQLLGRGEGIDRREHASQLLNRDISDTDFGPSIDFQVKPDCSHSMLTVQCTFEASTPQKAQLVLEWKAADGSKVWRSVKLKEFMVESGLQDAFISVDVRDLPAFSGEGNFTSYIWNPAFESIRLFEMKSYSYPANQWRYGLIRPVDECLPD